MSLQIRVGWIYGNVLFIVTPSRYLIRLLVIRHIFPIAFLTADIFILYLFQPTSSNIQEKNNKDDMAETTFSAERSPTSPTEAIPLLALMLPTQHKLLQAL